MTYVPYREVVRPEWLDAYGHMNEGYYLVAFNNALWDFFEWLGVGVSYFQTTGCGFYGAESHLRFLKEVRASSEIETTCLILGHDPKRVRYGAVMSADGMERATLEGVTIHFDTRSGRTAPMPAEVHQRMRVLQVSELPAWCGRSVTLERRSH